MIGSDSHGEHASETVPDHNGAIETLLANVFSELPADSSEHRPTDWRCAGEAGDGQYVAGAASAQMRDRGRPRVAGRGEAGNQQHRSPRAVDLNVKRVRVVRSPDREGGNGQKAKSDECRSAELSHAHLLSVSMTACPVRAAAFVMSGYIK
jgi:hypothetical protein